MDILEFKKFIQEFYNYLGNSQSNILKPNLQNYQQLRQNLDDQLTILNKPLPNSIYIKIDKLLEKEKLQKHIISVYQLPKKHPKIVLWKGDITSLQIDAIVNPANSQGLGCFQLRHKCLDNIIHSKAGPRLRDQCRKQLGGKEISTSGVMITPGFNLPCKYIIHTVGPIAQKNQKLDFNSLSQTYLNCLRIAEKYGCRHIAFPCISTGVFGYPQKESAQVALNTVTDWVKNKNMICVFCTFLPEDYQIYNSLFTNK